MMKNHQYLTEGLLESYVLGALSKEDRAEAAHLIGQDPDIATQLEALEMDMEVHFLENAVPPPPHVGTALRERLINNGIQKREEESHAQEPPPPQFARSPYIDVEVNDTHIRVHKNWRAAFIAVFILSKIFLVFGLYQYFKANSLEQEVGRLKATQQTTSPMPSGLRR